MSSSDDEPELPPKIYKPFKHTLLKSFNSETEFEYANYIKKTDAYFNSQADSVNLPYLMVTRPFMDFSSSSKSARVIRLNTSLICGDEVKVDKSYLELNKTLSEFIPYKRKDRRDGDET